MPWLYLGPDFRRARVWEQALGAGFDRIPTGRLLDEEAARLRRPFLTWLDVLNRRYGGDPIWWLTQLSERNTLVSPLFLHLCYLSAARTCLGGARAPGLIVAESWGLVQALRALVHKEGGVATVRSGWRAVLQRIKERALAVAMFAHFVLQAARRRRAARATRRGRVALPGAATAPRVLVATYFHRANLSEDGVFRDRYLPHLHEWLGGRGHEVWVLAAPVEADLTPRETYDWMRRSSTRFIIPEDWLTFGDYVGAAADGSRSARFRAVDPIVDGLDIGPLLAEERRRQAAGRSPREAGLIRRLPARLAAAGLAPEHLISWSENQMKEKALVAGWRAAFPGRPCAGVQNMPLYANVLNEFPRATECEAGLVADWIVCSGPLAATVVAGESSGRLMTRVGCALRYAYLRDRARAPRPSGESPAVLVALPVTPQAAAALLDLLAPVIRRRASWRWLVKPHPDYGMPAVEEILGRRVTGPGVTTVGGRLDEWFARVDAVVAAGSGTALEAVAWGLPIVLVGAGATFSLHPLEWFGPECARTWYDAEEIGAELDRITAGGPAIAEAGARSRDRVLEGWFAPVTDAGLAQFLPVSP